MMLYAFSITFCISLVAVMILHRLAKPLGLLDVPCTRKAHEGHVPLVGGMAVFIAASIGLLFYFGPSKLLNLYIISCSLMVFIGVLDVKVNSKLPIQVFERGRTKAYFYKKRK